MEGATEPEVVAILDHDDSMMAVAWRCSHCGGLTFDAHKFEVPTFCCRCGRKFSKHDYTNDEEMNEK